MEGYKDLQAAFAPATGGDCEPLILQVTQCDVMEGEKATKVKARLSLSDGVSRVMCMIQPKNWNQ